jgi:hypothetical protein
VEAKEKKFPRRGRTALSANCQDQRDLDGRITGSQRNDAKQKEFLEKETYITDERSRDSRIQSRRRPWKRWC